MRVLYISEGYTTHDRRFLATLSGDGHNVDHLRWKAESLEERPLPVGVVPVEIPDHVRGTDDGEAHQDAIEWLRGLAEREGYDLVLSGPVPTLGYMAAQAGIGPLVAVSWGSDMLVDVQNNDESRERATYALERSAGVIADCEAVRQAIHACAGTGDERILNIPYGIDLDMYGVGNGTSTIRRELGWNDKKVIISTRSWEPHYRIDVVLDAFKKIVDVNEDVRLLLVGNGSLGDEIRKRIGELRLNEFIHAPGRIGNDELPSHFQSADLYVSSSPSDGSSISLLEAMACRLPAIVTKGYGNLEWVIDGRNGWLVDAGDSNALADAIEDAFSDYDRLKKMAERNLAIVTEKADWKRNSRVFLDFCERIASGALVGGGIR